MVLDRVTLSLLKPAIDETWNAIAFDVVPICGDDNESAMEMCIDADRLEINGHDPEANKLVHDLCREHGYMELLQFLSKHIQLL